jgi:hypothetical protein
MTEPSTQDQLLALIDRVQEQGIEIASLRRLVYAMGSHLLGGPPGTQALHVWHQDQINPAPPPASSTVSPVALNTESNAAQSAAPNPISAATVSGTYQTASPPVSPGSAGQGSSGVSTPSSSTAAAASSPPAAGSTTLGSSPTAQGAPAK